MISRIKGILVTPAAEWEKISNEKSSLISVFLLYFLILAIIPIAATYIGWTYIGFRFFVFSGKGVDLGIKQSIITAAATFAVYFIPILVIDVLAPAFKSERNINRTAQLVGYSLTAFLLCGIFNVHPGLSIIGIFFGLFSLYALYTGFASMKNTPEYQITGYFVVSLLVIFVTYLIMVFVLMTVLFPNGYMNFNQTGFPR